MVNHLFDENVTYYHMFLLADKAKTVLEKERDDLSANDALTEDLSLLYKRKLQNLYRIRNNSFVLLLRNGVKCTKIPMDGDNMISIDVDGDVHVCKESILKTILQKDYDKVLEKVLDKNVKTVTEEVIDSTETNKNENVNTKADKETKEETDIEEVKTNEGNIDVNTDTVEIEDIEIPKVELNETEQELSLNPEVEKALFDEPKLEETKSELETEVGTEPEVKNESEEIKLETATETEDTAETTKETENEAEAEAVTEVESKTEIESTTNPEPAQKHKIEDEFHTFREGGEPDVELIEPTKDEPNKKASQMIMDIYKIKVKNVVEESKEDDSKFKIFKKEKVEQNLPEESEITLKIIPLKLPNNGNEFSSDILVYMECDNGTGCFYSNVKGRKTVMADNKIHSFLITGSWENGRFKTTVRATNKTLMNKAELSRQVERIRSVDKFDSGIGHPVLFIKKNEKENLLKIHVLPKEYENGKDGMAPAIFCMEDLTKDERFTYRTKEKNDIHFEFKGNIYKIYAKWVDDTLVTSLEKVK